MYELLSLKYVEIGFFHISFQLWVHAYFDVLFFFFNLHTLALCRSFHFIISIHFNALSSECNSISHFKFKIVIVHASYLALSTTLSLCPFHYFCVFSYIVYCLLTLLNLKIIKSEHKNGKTWIISLKVTNTQFLYECLIIFNSLFFVQSF